jgi:hypothetical protein
MRWISQFILRTMWTQHAGNIRKTISYTLIGKYKTDFFSIPGEEEDGNSKVLSCTILRGLWIAGIFLEEQEGQQ